MAQIRKYQDGGSTKKYGHLIIDGKDYEMNDDNLADFVQYAKSQDDNTQIALGQIINSLRAGNTESIDSLQNKRSGASVTSLSEKDQKKLQNRAYGSAWDSLTENDRYRFNKGTAAAARWAPGLGGTAKTAPKDTSSEAAKTRIYDSAGWFKYDKDADGKLVFSENDVNNQSYLKRIQNVLDALSGNADNYIYNKGYSQETKDALADWYAGMDDNQKQNFYAELLNRIKSPDQLTSADRSFLKNLFLSEETGDSSASVGGYTPATWKSIAGWGGNEDYLKNNNIILGTDDSGRLTISGNNPYASGNWLLNDYDWIDPRYNNGYIVNGKFYTEDEALNTQDPTLQSIFSQIVSNNPYQTYGGDTGWYNRAEASGFNYNGKGKGGNFATLNPNTNYNYYWTPYFQAMGSSGVRDWEADDVTGAFINADGRRVLRYVDPSQTTKAGRPIFQFVVRNTDGSYSQPMDWTTLKNSGMVPLQNLDAYGAPQTALDISEYQTIKGKEYAQVIEFGTAGQRNTILIGRDGKFYLKKTNDSKPRLITDEEALKEILLKPDAEYDNKYLENMTSNKPVDDSKEGILNRVGQQLGLGYIPEDKSGGIINKANELLNKFQAGGAINGNINNLDLYNSANDISKAHAMDGSDGGLTKAEKAQIAAAVGDLLGVGVSLGADPVTGAVGAGIGAASSLTKFGADISQDGFQLKDLGNLGVNLGFDALSVPAGFIPGLDTLTQGAKFVRMMRSIGKPFLKWMGTIGASTAAINTASKIINGEKWTSQDMTTLVSGLAGGLAAGKQWKESIGNAKMLSGVSKGTIGSSPESGAIATLRGKKIQFSNEEVNGLLDKGVDEAGVTARLKDLIKSKSGIEGLNDNELKSVYKSLGLSTNKGTFTLTSQKTVPEIEMKVKSGDTEQVIKIGGEELKPQLEGVTKEQAISILKEKYGLDAGQANEAYNKLGLTTKLGKVSFTEVSPSRSGKTVSYNPQSNSGYSTTRLLFDPVARAKVEGSNGLFGIGKQEGMFAGKDFSTALAEARTALANGNATEAQKALLAESAWNPNLVGMSTEGTTVLNGRGSFGGNPYRDSIQETVKPTETPAETIKTEAEKVIKEETEAKETKKAIEELKELYQGDYAAYDKPTNGRMSKNKQVHLTQNKNRIALDSYNKAVSGNSNSDDAEALLTLLESDPEYLEYLSNGNWSIQDKKLRTTQTEVSATLRRKIKNLLNTDNPSDIEKAKGLAEKLNEINELYGLRLKRGGKILFAQNGTALDWNNVNNWSADQLNKTRGALSDAEWNELQELMKVKYNGASWNDTQLARANELVGKRGPAVDTSSITTPVASTTQTTTTTPIDMSQYTEVVDEQPVEEEPLPFDWNQSTDGMSEYDKQEFLKAKAAHDANNGVMTGSKIKELPYIDTSTLRSVGRLGVGMNYLNKAFNSYNDAIRAAGLATKSNPTEIYDNYYDNGVAKTYSDIAAKERSLGSTYANTTSNAGLANALRKSYESDALDKELQGRLTQAQAYDQWKSNDLTARRNYADKRNEVADYNRSLQANVASQLAQAKSTKLNSIYSQLVNPFMTEMETKIQTEQQKANQLRDTALQSSLQSDRDAYINNATQAWRDEYYNDADLKNTYDSPESYFQSKYAQEYGNIISAANKKYQDDYLKQANKLLQFPSNRYNSRIAFSKTGGSTSKYERAPFIEKAALEGLQSANKATLQIQKSLLTRLEKLFK